ncbi:MAG: hypothetical protein D6775_06755 [Caldilineae bacterium]|nr:MAG: hypothetical protein D6775_06755 [Caldilineae bacterium]
MKALSRCASTSYVRLYATIFILSAATLSWEIVLTRLFAITQFYHFAFLAVNVALLGYGVSGVFISLRPGQAAATHATSRLSRYLGALSLAFAAALVVSYATVNLLPFDSYAIAWDSRQLWLLLLYYLALVLPFFCSGLAIGLALSTNSLPVNRVYAANLLGSAAGALVTPLAISLFQLPGSIFIAAAAACLAALAAFETTSPRQNPHFLLLPAALLLVGMALAPPAFLQVRLSPYKGLPQALHYPDAVVVAQRDGPRVRTTVIRSSGVRSLPGLSFQYRGPLPPQLGLLADGDDLSPVIDVDHTDDWRFLDYLPEVAAYQLRPQGPALVLEPRGGLAIWQALGGKAGQRPVVAIEPDAQSVRVLDRLLGRASPYAQPDVVTITESPRSYLPRDRQRYAVVHLALTRPFRPVTSGAYSLGETYDLTVEALVQYLAHLSPDGILVMSRWLQTPPSESARGLSLVLAALESMGISAPSDHIVVWRGVQIATFFVKLTPWTDAELAIIRHLSADLRFDLVLAPGLRPDEINRYNILPEPYYEDVFGALISAPDRRDYLRSFPFEISPPRDDHPFFYHFFKWRQTPVILRTLGQTWQPFGGSGILVLVALLVLTMLVSSLLVFVPVLIGRLPARQADGEASPPSRALALTYFAALGLGFLLIEIPLIQRFILYLGHPTLAVAVVLAALLLWTGLGSLAAPRFSTHRALSLLLVVLAAYSLATGRLIDRTLGLPLMLRLAITFLWLAPPGLLMGMPFPLGLAGLRMSAAHLIPWAWGVNGFASVAASVLAALLALQWGFTRVLVAGFLCYGLAWLVVRSAPSLTARSLAVPRRP